MATTSSTVRTTLFAVTLMVVVIDPSFCFERFGWMAGESCDSIPYPFGTPGTALPGFELKCHSGKAYLLPSNNQSYLIRAINTNTLSIDVRSVYVQCYHNDGSEIMEDNSHLLDLRGTPYSVSTTENVLVNIGCNNLMKIITTADAFGEQNGYGGKSGCVTFCDVSTEDNIMQNSLDCSGMACCTSALPGGGMKSFNLEFSHIKSSSDSRIDERFSVCSVYFIAQDISAVQYFSLSEEIYNGSYLESKEKKFYPYIQTLILDWAIGHQICEIAVSYLCKNNSDCHNYGGYYCKCSGGFQGNPYVLGGCTDINECEDPVLNPCVGKCINEIGNVSCACPHGMVGDGKKQGSGCQRLFRVNLTLGLVLGSLFVVTTLSFCVYLSSQKRKLIKKRDSFFRQNGGHILKQRYGAQGIDPKTKIFTEEQLKKATENYHESRVLGRGGFGTVYRGVLQDKSLVAIKKSKFSEESQVEQFINEITILCQINHKNVVKLLGCCLETEVPLLVYEFIPNGTLFNRIHDPVPLFWKERLQIAADTAGALAYLHSTASPPIIHRDIKSTNILLDENYIAKISDFGASRSVPFDQTHVTTVVQGTFGYLDPEYFTTHQLTEKSDVYSFGVVLAELWLREKPISFDRPIEVQGLAAYFNMLFSEGQLVRVMEPYIIEEAGFQQIEAIGRLTTRCLSLKGEKRPTMRVVATELERLRQATEQQSDCIDMDANVPLLSGPRITGDTNYWDGRGDEVTKQYYSLETSMLSSMELPR